MHYTCIGHDFMQGLNTMKRTCCANCNVRVATKTNLARFPFYICATFSDYFYYNLFSAGLCWCVNTPISIRQYIRGALLRMIAVSDFLLYPAQSNFSQHMHTCNHLIWSKTETRLWPWWRKDPHDHAVAKFQFPKCSPSIGPWKTHCTFQSRTLSHTSWELRVQQSIIWLYRCNEYM